MLMNVLRAQAFVQTVSVSTQMGLFAVNVQWVTTLITLECAVWVSAESVPHFSLLMLSFLYSAKGLSGTLGGSGIYKAKISSHNCVFSHSTFSSSMGLFEGGVSCLISAFNQIHKL